MRRSITMWLALLGPLGVAPLASREAAAQVDRAITGRVLAEADSAPLAGVRIRALDTQRPTLTDSEGRFRLGGTPRSPSSWRGRRRRVNSPRFWTATG